MATIAQLDEKIEKKKEEIARYETRKKALIAKEREMHRKWKNAVLTAIGQIVVDAAQCSWDAVDLAAFEDWLGSGQEELSGLVVVEQSDPEAAKERLDIYRQAKQNKASDPTEEVGE